DQIRQRRCKASFSYVPQNEDELELKIGDVIDILVEVEEGWWEGSLNGKTGMFPSNFTRELEDTPASLDTSTRSSQEELRSNRTSKDSPGSESDGGESRTDSGEIQPKKAQVRKSPSVAPGTMKAEPEGKVKVIFPYDAQNEDELSIKEGEIISIINRDCADAGWWMGEIGGRKGVFPDNFVKLLIPDVEKERPKKPPPPSAPSAKHTTEKRLEVRKVPPERPEHLPHRPPDDNKGEEVKVGEIPKPTLPSKSPKKPHPPKTSSSHFPPRRPDRPERPPTVPCESPKFEGGAVTPDPASDRSKYIDVVDLDSVVLSTEKLNHPTAMRPRVLDRRPRSQIISTVPDSKGVLPPKPVVLPPPSIGSLALRPTSPSPSTVNHTSSGLSPSPERRPAPTLEELRGQLRELRASVELLKSQHRQEMKQLASDLEEEKRIRLTLQMEVEQIKKSACEYLWEQAVQLLTEPERRGGQEDRGRQEEPDSAFIPGAMDTAGQGASATEAGGEGRGGGGESREGVFVGSVDRENVSSPSPSAKQRSLRAVYVLNDGLKAVLATSPESGALQCLQRACDAESALLTTVTFGRLDFGETSVLDTFYDA
ncbi:unnamed protein product, partial [Coregonus sp. 'balchen']